MKKILVLLCCCLLVGCTSIEKSIDEPIETVLIEPSESIDLAIDYSAKKLNETVNPFGWDLFNTFDLNENHFFSPLSIHLALGMVANGAENETLDELLNVLHVDRLEDINSGSKQLLRKKKPLVKELIFNSIWLNARMEYKETLQEDFIDPLYYYFYTDTYSCDINTEQGVEDVNGWVNEKTDGMIESVLDYPADIPMLLLNTVFYEGEWLNKFNKEHTKPQTFYGLSQETTVQMMHQRNMFTQYFENEEVKGISLPYAEDGMTMIVMMSNNETPIGEIFKTMSNEEKEELIQSVKNGESIGLNRVSLPKFELEYSSKKLNEKLMQLGLNKVFSEEAELGKLGESFYVGNVLHKTKLEVFEDGTRAAAVTGIIMYGGGVMDPTAKEFIVDQPFVLVLQDDEGINWFVGLVNDLNN